MAEEVELLSGEVQSDESSRAIQACNDFLRLGPGRSLPRLAEQYTKSNQEQPPTKSLGTLKKWSMQYAWAERAAGYDATVIEAQKNARRRSIMEEGLALDYERVDKLKRLASFLEGQIYEQGEGGVYHNVWVPDVKQIGAGEFVERVDIERFNPAIIEQYRETLNDIAEETGGRRKSLEVTGKDGGPMQITRVEVVRPAGPDAGKDGD